MNASTEQNPKPGVYPLDATTAFAEPPAIGDDTGATALLPPLPEMAPPVPTRRRGRAAKWFFTALGIFLGGVLIADAFAFVDTMFDRHPALGIAFALTLFVAIAAGITWITAEIRALHRIRSVDALRTESAGLEGDGYGEAARFVARVKHAMDARPVVTSRFVALEDRILDTHSDRDVLSLFVRDVVRPLDQEAYAVVARAARDTAVGVSASPVAMLDAVISLWRGVRMIRQVAEVYGLRPGLVGTASLLRRALTNAAFTATVDVAGDAWSAHLGGRVAGFVSTRLAEGVFAAVRVARLGLLTMEMCRPLPFTEGDKPRLSQLRAEIASWFTRFG